MEKRFGWRSILFIGFIAACAGDKVTSSGVCPEYCNFASVQATDTVLPSAVGRDSSYTGYVSANSAQQLMVAGPGGMQESRAIMRFFRFPDTLTLNDGDTATRPVVQVDSFQLMLVVNRATPGRADLNFGIYRLPASVDTTATFTQLDPYFQDSALIREFPVPTAEQDDSIFIRFPASALPTFAQDSNYGAFGIALRSSAAFAELGSVETPRQAILTRYVLVDSVPGQRVVRSTGAVPQFDTFVFQPIPAPGPNVLVVGGAPSARAFLRLTVPSRIVDSSNVVRATLLLTPATPVIAAPGDTLRVLGRSMATDIGPKSPVGITVADSAGRVGGKALPGMTDTVKVDVTDIVRQWKSDSTAARAIVLSMNREGGSFGQLQFWSTADPTRKPILQITYVPPLKYEGR